MKKIICVLLLVAMSFSIVACDVDVESEICGVRWIYYSDDHREEWITFNRNGIFNLEIFLPWDDSHRSGRIESSFSGYYKIDYDNSKITTFFISEDDIWMEFEYKIYPHILFNKVSIHSNIAWNNGKLKRR